MKILVINGSPRLERSNSLRMTRKFLEGIQEVRDDVEINQINTSTMNIKPCKGCFGCWKTTPGHCVQTGDDMDEAIRLFTEADVLIWSFPLFYYSLPGTMKIFMDRLCPLNRPVILDRQDGKGCGTHPARYDEERQRHVLISSCGHYSYKGNYDSVVAQWDLKYGVGRALTLFCGEGEMFPVPMYAEKVEKYLNDCKQAGRDFGQYGTILFATRQELDKLIVPKEELQQVANSYYAHMEKKAAARAAEKAAAEAAAKAE
ncbi:MAG: flavodoxin family protein [Oscillospiraceae bacterium]|nr:flavodoxin family protein [Oscillospiraceae bacterium]